MGGEAKPAGTLRRVCRPDLPSFALVRTPLLQRLERASHPVVLVTGPAGFGKSVLVADWLQRSAHPSAWLSLDDLDNDPKRFLNHVAAAFETLGGEAASDAASALRQLRGGADILRDDDVIRGLSAIAPESIIAFDDVHKLESPESVALLRSLLEVGVGPRFVLISRVNPPLPLGRMRAAGRLLEVRENDLRFSTDESRALFDALIPGGLEPDLAQRLADRTEGWVAGLRMAAIALEHADDRRAIVDAFTGGHQFITDYLVEEVVSRQSEPVQRFLMDTSILSHFTPESCAAVTQQPDAGALLQRVHEANLFVVRLTGEGDWYRYHHLFAELLQFRLRRSDPLREHELHARASEWFEAQDDLASALEHAARLPDVTRLAQLLDRYALRFLSRSEMGSLTRWLRRLPDPLALPYPTLLLCIGWLRVLAEKEPDLTALFDAAAAALDSPPDGYDDAAVQAVRFELDILRAYHARFAGRLEESIAIGEALLPALPPARADLRGRILFNHGRSWMMLGDVQRAAQLIEESVRVNTQAGTHYLVLTGLGQGAALMLESHGAAAARGALEAAVQMANERGLTRLPAFSTILFQLGHVLSVQDELDEAMRHYERAIAIGTMSDMPDGRANGLAGMARILAAQGRFDEAHERLVALAAMAATLNVGLSEGDVTVPMRRHALYLHAAGDVTALPPSGFATPPAITERWHVGLESSEVCRMLECVRAGTEAGDAAALAAADRIIAESARCGRYVAATVAGIVTALIRDVPDRWQLLDGVLTEAARRAYVLPLLEVGPRLRPLLQAAMGQPLSAAARAHARALLDRLPAPAEPGAQVLFADALPAVSELTDREAEVLGYVCRGFSNKAIARSMYVSPETVKTHLKHIFDKLDVSRRRDAAAKARRLGLAPVD